MTLKLRTPSKRRASALGSVLGTLGSAVGTVAGALPVTPARSKPSKTRRVLKLGLPVAAAGAVVGAVVARRRRNGTGDWSAPVTSGAETEFAAAATPAAPPTTPPVTETEFAAAATPAAPPTTPPVTETAREKAEQTGDDRVPGTETARAAGSETPAAGEAGER
jgi:hypothetical protein